MSTSRTLARLATVALAAAGLALPVLGTPAPAGAVSPAASMLGVGVEPLCSVRPDGTVACWGDNSSGQLGDGTTTSSDTPVAVATTGTPLQGATVTGVAVGLSHRCARTSAGAVACWGAGDSGQLGDGSSGGSTTPIAPAFTGTSLAGRSIAQVVAGGNHTCVLTTDGAIGCWGDNAYGQLGIGTTTSSSVPVEVPTAGTPLQGKAVVQITAGFGHTCALTSESGMACWGLNRHAWPGIGEGAAGQLGDGSGTNSSVPVAVATTGTLLEGTDIAELSAGLYHTCARTTDGVVACWGDNTRGQLGTGTTTQSYAPVAVTTTGTPLDGAAVAQISAGASGTCAATAGGAAACWGSLGGGVALGDGTSTGSTVPVAVTTTGTPLAGRTVAEVSLGLGTACARATDTTVACWGSAWGHDSLVPLTVTAPGAPDLNVSAVGNQEVTLTWTAPASDGGAAITGYVIQPYLGATALTPIPTTAGTGATASQQRITGLTNGASYTFRIAAVNGVGTGPNSAAAGPAVPAATAPGAPTITSVTGGNTQVTVQWSAPSSDGGTAVTGYEVTPYIGATAQTTRTFATTATTQVITGLANGTAYRFKVAAVNAVGVGAQSGFSASVTPAPTPPGAPTIISVAPGNARATLTWTAPSVTNGAPVTGYVVTPYVNTTAGTPTTFASTATTQTVTGLLNGYPYHFTVAAVNSAGTGTPSASSATVTPSTLPGAPTIGAVTLAGTTGSVAFTPPAYIGGGPITGYTATCTSTNGGTTRTGTRSASPVSVTSLTAGRAYRCTVKATNAFGTGAASAASASVTVPTAPGAPATATASPASAAATVAWTAPTTTGGSAITSYVVKTYKGLTLISTKSFAATARSGSITGLLNGTAYTFQVTAVNAVGSSAVKATSAIVVGAPKAPTGVTAVRVASGQIRVSFTAGANNGSAITSFVVTCSSSNGGTTRTKSGTASPITVTTLSAGKAYRCSVYAHNARGNGPASALSASVTA